MKISIHISVDLPDPAQWTEAFGEEGPTEIRQAVKAYVGNGIAQQGVFANGEVGATVTWR